MILITVIINILVMIIYMFYLRIGILNSLEVVHKFMYDTNPISQIELSMVNPNTKQNEILIMNFTRKWDKKLHNLRRLLAISIYITILLGMGATVLYYYNYRISAISFSIGNIVLVSALLFYFLLLPQRFISERKFRFQL